MTYDLIVIKTFVFSIFVALAYYFLIGKDIHMVLQFSFISSVIYGVGITLLHKRKQKLIQSQEALSQKLTGNVMSNDRLVNYYRTSMFLKKFNALLSFIIIVLIFIGDIKLALGFLLIIFLFSMLNLARGYFASYDDEILTKLSDGEEA